ncbi:MAG: EamA family transporter [Clostridia bacterium]
MIRWMLLVLVGACSYGILSTFVKFAYDEGYQVGDVVNSQMMFGAAMLWILALLFGRNRPTRNEWLTLLAVGIPTGLTGILYYASLQYLDASLAIVVLFQFTWIGVLLDSLLERKRPGRDRLIALVLLLSGTVLAGGLVENSLTAFSFTGAGLGLLAAISYALQILFSGKAALRVNDWSRSAIMMTGSMLLCFIVYPPAFLLNGTLADGLWLWGLLLALFGAILPTLLFNVGVPKIGVGLSSILGAAELPTAVLLSSFVLQEAFSLLQWAGVALILVGVALPELLRKKQSAVQL